MNVDKFLPDARSEKFEKGLLEQKLIGIGTLIFGPLFLGMVFAAAVVDHAYVARDFAIAAAGNSYLSMLAQYHPPASGDALSEYLVLGSIVAGTLAGFFLLFGI